MSAAMQSSVGIVAYLALFAGAGIVFLFVNLLVGKFLRPADPNPEKGEIYECGEPTIGSSFVQFDLRFYVVALLFIIFDVEIAFFFPWAVVFGKSTHLTDRNFEVVQMDATGKVKLTPEAANVYRELGIRNPVVPTDVPKSLAGKVDSSADQLTRSRQIVQAGSRQLALFAIVDIAVFFGVLMVGFAYLWKRGDLNWVRAVSAEQTLRSARPAPDAAEQEPALSA